MPKEKKRMEFRYYDIPKGQYVLPKLGRGWEQEYGLGYGRMLHFHNYLEIGYCYHGRGELLIEDRSYKYGNKMFTVIPENIPHTTISAPGNICKWEFLFVDIKEFIRTEMCSDDMSTDDIIKIFNKRGTLKTAKNHPEMARLILKIMDECRNENIYYRESIKGYLRALVIEVLRLDEEREKALRGNRISSYIRRTIEYINTNYAKELKVSDIAGDCGLSESHFRRIFEENMNMKPLDYLNMVRIDEACRLIRKGEQSMEEIGEAVGYSTPSTFNRNFKKLTDMKPLEWKKVNESGGIVSSDFHISAQKGWEAKIQ
ncbi:MAG: helix-turn-helix transcriptional regulator [Lachnospiraceae bacterium]|nr:helix-turn-helix transcriptional regulator [Lachnospiraceae bacterium]